MRFCIVSGVVGANHGQGRVNLEIAREAIARGHEVVIVAERVDDVTIASGAHCVVLPPPRWLPSRLLRDQWFARSSQIALAREALADRGGGFHAILANGFVTWAACDVNAVHFVHASWARSPHHPWRLRRDVRALYAWIYSRLNVVLERMAFGRAACLVAVSSGVARDLRRCAPRTRIAIVPNGVDVDEFHPGRVDRQALGLPVGVPLAVFAGDLTSARKNLDTVLRAAATLPTLHVAVAGRGNAQHHAAHARRLGMGERLHLLGFRTDMPAIMRACEVLVFPSRYEPCGLVLLEALASGVPVVTARSVGGSELINEEVGVVVEDCDDADAVSRAVAHVIGDPVRHAAMAARGRALAETLTWPNTARSYVDLLVEAARSREAAVHA